MKSVVMLVKEKGPTSIYIDVRITGEGDLLFSGQDLGEAPKKVFGDSDYEYWLRIAGDQKDRVLMALIEKLYRGNASVISEMQELLDSKGIPNEFSSY